MKLEIPVLFFGFYKQELNQMNRIKIIKRADLQSPPEASETALKKVNPAVIKRQAVKVIGNWIDERREQKPKDARRAFADLFTAHPSAIS